MPSFHPARMVLLVERTASGVVLSSPHLPGWRCTANGTGILRALDAAWTEHSIRAYANSKGKQYDLTTPDEPDDEETPQAGDGTWHNLGDGRWRSPSGRVYAETTMAVQRVLARQ